MSKAKFYILLTLACVIWGATPATGKLVVGSLSPLMLTATRFTIIALILFAWLFVTKQYKDLKPPRAVIYITIAMGFMGMTVHNGLLFTGLNYTTATNTALIESIGPTITTVLAFLFIGERLNKFGWLGIFISCLGAFVIITKGDLNVLLSLSFNIGDLIILACEAAWSAYVIIGWNIHSRISTVAVTAWSGLFGAVQCYLLGLVTGTLWYENITPSVIFGFSYITFASGLFAFIAWNYAANSVGASKAGSFIYLVPLTGAFLGVFLLNEPLSFAQIIGACLIVSGMVFTVRSKVKLKHKEDNLLKRYDELQNLTHEELLEHEKKLSAKE